MPAIDGVVLVQETLSEARPDISQWRAARSAVAHSSVRSRQTGRFIVVIDRVDAPRGIVLRPRRTNTSRTDGGGQHQPPPFSSRPAGRRACRTKRRAMSPHLSSRWLATWEVGPERSPMRSGDTCHLSGSDHPDHRQSSTGAAPPDNESRRLWDQHTRPDATPAVGMNAMGRAVRLSARSHASGDVDLCATGTDSCVVGLRRNRTKRPHVPADQGHLRATTPHLHRVAPPEAGGGVAADRGQPAGTLLAAEHAPVSRTAVTHSLPNDHCASAPRAKRGEHPWRGGVVRAPG